MEIDIYQGIIQYLMEYRKIGDTKSSYAVQAVRSLNVLRRI